MSEIHDPLSSEQTPSQADIIKVLQGIFNILDESIGRNGLSRTIRCRELVEGPITSDSQGQLRNRVLLSRTLSELEISLIDAEKALALLPGSETILTAISQIIRSIRVRKHDKESSPVFLVDFGKSIGQLEGALKTLKSQVPTAAFSAQESISVYISCLRKAHELCEDPASNIRSLINALQDLISATHRFSLSTTPYLCDRRRSMKDDFLTVSAVSALFCTMPISLLPSTPYNTPSAPYFYLETDAIISLLAYLSTILCTASFISAFIIARLLDGETSLRLDNFSFRWIFYCPPLFLGTGALLFFAGFTVTVAVGASQTTRSITLGIIATVGVVALLAYVAWRWHHSSPQSNHEMCQV